MAGMQKYCKSQKTAMKLKNINLFEGQIGSICRRFDDFVFDQAKKIDNDLSLNFADFGVDQVLHSIEGPNLVPLHALLASDHPSSSKMTSSISVSPHQILPVKIHQNLAPHL